MMFELIQRAWVLSRRPPIDEVIREIAKRSVVEVRRRLSTNVWNMNEPEMRGYVRARAARPVRFEAVRIATEQGWRIALSDSLIASSLERTVHLVVHQLRMQPVVATSAVHATLRAAG